MIDLTVAPEQLVAVTASPRQTVSVGFRAPHVVDQFVYEDGELQEHQFHVDTLYTGVSAGTELTQFRGSNPYLHGRWDESLKLFLPSDGEGQASNAYPVRSTGYMEVGQVVASRTPAAREGEVVCMAYGHKSGHRADARHDFFVPLPEGVDPILGIYVAQMGPICANGILHADEEVLGEHVTRLGEGLRGRHVAVFGAGVVGLLTAMMARWAGAAEVAVVDRAPDRLAVAKRLGMFPVNTTDGDAAVALKERWQTGTAGDLGADTAFQCSGSDVLLNLALNSLRPQGTVIDLGFYQGGASNVRFGEAFHHNGLRHICAQIRRVPRRLAGTWNRHRLALETINFLRDCGPAVREHLITHVVPFAQAQEVYDALDAGQSEMVQAVLYPELPGGVVAAVASDN
ncbi:MAG: zinc-binding alcohol dehydrogenase [Chloroflexi bacterium]|nr:zinc-binding alcohol dehydrogenase [Chloroflexota bacterium]